MKKSYSLKQLLSSAILTSLYLLPVSSHAVLLVTEKSADGQFIPVQFDDPRYLRSKEIIDVYEWPMPALKVRENPALLKGEWADLVKSEENAEETFINHQLEQGGMDTQAFWIPTTLWELAGILEKSKDPTLWEQLASGTDPRGLKHFSSKEERQRFQASVGPLLNEFIKFHYDNKNLSEVTKDLNLLERISIDLIADVIQVVEDHRSRMGQKLTDERKSMMNNYLAGFRKELEDFSQGRPTLIKAALETELEAHKKNSALLWRGTDGVPFDSQRQLLDFSISKSVEGRCSVEQIVNFPETVFLGKNGLLNRKILSYAYSLLSGFTGDGPLMNYGGACTYAYASVGKSKFTYALIVGKNQIYGEGQIAIVLPPTKSMDGIFGQGECFHPRTASDRAGVLKSDPVSEQLSEINSYHQIYYVERTLPKDVHSEVRCHPLAQGPLPMSDHLLSELEKVLLRELPDASEAYRADVARKVVALSNLTEIWDGIIGEHVKVLKYENTVVLDPASIPELKETLELQKVVPFLLRKKLDEVVQ